MVPAVESLPEDGSSRLAYRESPVLPCFALESGAIVCRRWSSTSLNTSVHKLVTLKFGDILSESCS